MHRGDAHLWDSNPTAKKRFFHRDKLLAFGRCVLRRQRCGLVTLPLVRGQLSGGNGVWGDFRVVDDTRLKVFGTFGLADAYHHPIHRAAVHELPVACRRPHRVSSSP